MWELAFRQTWKCISQSCLTFCEPLNCSLPASSCPWDFPGTNTGVDCHSLLQGIFPAQGSNPGLLHSPHTVKVGSLLSEPPGKPLGKHTSLIFLSNISQESFHITTNMNFYYFISHHKIFILLQILLFLNFLDNDKTCLQKEKQVYILVYIALVLLLLLLSRFSRVWLWDPIDGSPPGSTKHLLSYLNVSLLQHLFLVTGF